MRLVVLCGQWVTVGSVWTRQRVFRERIVLLLSFAQHQEYDRHNYINFLTITKVSQAASCLFLFSFAEHQEYRKVSRASSCCRHTVK
jgi:hypothetical protein